MPAVKREAPSASSAPSAPIVPIAPSVPAESLTSGVAPPTSIPKNVILSSSTQKILSTSEDLVSGK